MAPTPKEADPQGIHTWGGTPRSQTHTHSLRNARCVTSKKEQQARQGEPPTEPDEHITG